MSEKKSIANKKAYEKRKMLKNAELQQKTTEIQPETQSENRPPTPRPTIKRTSRRATVAESLTTKAPTSLSTDSDNADTEELYITEDELKYLSKKTEPTDNFFFQNKPKPKPKQQKQTETPQNSMMMDITKSLMLLAIPAVFKSLIHVVGSKFLTPTPKPSPKVESTPQPDIFFSQPSRFGL